MARGVRKGVESQIAEINAKIAKKKDEIKALELKRGEMVSSQQAEMAVKIMKIANEKGMTVEELLAAVEKK